MSFFGALKARCQNKAREGIMCKPLVWVKDRELPSDWKMKLNGVDILMLQKVIRYNNKKENNYITEKWLKLSIGKRKHPPHTYTYITHTNIYIKIHFL